MPRLGHVGSAKLARPTSVSTISPSHGWVSADMVKENYCVQPVHGYNTKWYDNKEHQGGYSTHVRAQELFVFPIPDKLASTDAASM